MCAEKKLSDHELNALAKDVVRLSKLLTREREGLPAAYLRDAGLRTAYFLYYLPANLSKIHKPLRELSLHTANVFAKETLRVLDIGAGPATASLGVLRYFSGQERRHRFEFTAVDQVRENLKEAEALFTPFREENKVDASLTTIETDIENTERHVHGRFDVIILSNVLNELFSHEEKKIEKRIGIVNHILKTFLADDGSGIIIEPALRETSRDLLAVRDGIIEQGFHVYSPCLGNGECPALVNSKDWCHEDIPWKPTTLVRELDELAGLRKDSLKFSYLVIRKDFFSLADICAKDSFRVVSEPLVSKGKMEFYFCDGKGRKLVARLDKDASSSNDAFNQLKRGDVVTIERLVDEGKRFKVEKDTIVIPALGASRRIL